MNESSRGNALLAELLCAGHCIPINHRSPVRVYLYLKLLNKPATVLILFS